jgi:acetyl-CoA C-acetyltransferase
MSDAYVFDAVRTPRGRGRSSGSLHEVSPLRLAAGVLRDIRDRNDLDTSQVDDVILGVADPVNEQGADIARTAVLVAGYDQGTPGVQINRFCASGLEACNMAAAQVMSGQSDIVIGGGVESMSRIEMFSSGGALVSDPHFTLPNYFVPQGISAEPHCDYPWLFACRRRQLRGRKPETSGCGMVGRPLRALGRSGSRRQ